MVYKHNSHSNPLVEIILNVDDCFSQYTVCVIDSYSGLIIMTFRSNNYKDLCRQLIEHIKEIKSSKHA